MLTQKDLEDIEKVVDEKIESRTSNLPTKDEFYTKMDEVVGELKTIREEQAVLSGLNTKVNDHDERIFKLEKKLRVQVSI